MRLLALVILVAGCAKDPGNTPGFIDVPGNSTLEIQVPAGVHPMKGQHGLQSDDKTFTLIVEHPRAEDAADVAALKAKLADVATDMTVQTTSDGWLATYAMKQVRLDESEHILGYGLQMRRTIDGRVYKCAAGMLPTKESLDPVIKACNSIQPKQKR
jgi:hypothetical protein